MASNIPTEQTEEVFDLSTIRDALAQDQGAELEQYTDRQLLRTVMLLLQRNHVVVNEELRKMNAILATIAAGYTATNVARVQATAGAPGTNVLT